MSDETQSIPEVGQALSMSDLDMILQAIGDRRKNFPEEPAALTIAVVLMNIGDRFSTVTCVNGEYTDAKMNVVPTDGVPVCPDGHPMTQGPAMKLGWLEEEL